MEIFAASSTVRLRDILMTMVVVTLNPTRNVQQRLRSLLKNMASKQISSRARDLINNRIRNTHEALKLAGDIAGAEKEHGLRVPMPVPQPQPHVTNVKCSSSMMTEPIPQPMTSEKRRHSRLAQRVFCILQNLAPMRFVNMNSLCFEQGRLHCSPELALKQRSPSSYSSGYRVDQRENLSKLPMKNSSSSSAGSMKAKWGVSSSDVFYHFSTSGMSVATATGITHPLGSMKAKWGVSSSDVFYHFSTSGMSVATATGITHPLDVLKVRLQMQLVGQRGPLTGMGKLSMQVVKSEGLRALYLGLTPALMRSVLYGGLRLGLYEPSKYVCELAFESRNVLMKIASGAFSGAVATALTNPVEVLKVRLQMRRTSTLGPIQELQKIASEEGIAALWKGVGPAMTRAAALTASQLATYDESKQSNIVILSSLFSDVDELDFSSGRILSASYVLGFPLFCKQKVLVVFTKGGSRCLQDWVHKQLLPSLSVSSCVDLQDSRHSDSLIVIHMIQELKMDLHFGRFVRFFSSGSYKSD
ncbi:hypothetical protein SASPL_100043 [Salvia splendens]|uniref:Mitochondrial substrate carrier family protein ucpB n=1 Tax=Salvia splendens TaxID=180675 RepID=A0A8X8YLM6_SALSN|nr:hypothetical protein SASPL_100043 [Salvia splendens]